MRDLASAESVAALQAERVNDLRRQLAEAEAKLENDRTQVSLLQQKKSDLDFSIARLNERANALQTES